MDSVSTKKRSSIMKAIRCKDTGIELKLRKELRKRGYRFKTNYKKLNGKPDIVFLDKKLAIFIDSCFWHGCKQHCRMPNSNQGYWFEKIKRNKIRDRSVNRWFKKEGWIILRFWEHSIKKRIVQIISRIECAIYMITHEIPPSHTKQPDSNQE